MLLFWIASAGALIAAGAWCARPLIARSGFVAAGASAGALAAATIALFAASGGAPRPGLPYEARIDALRQSPPETYGPAERLAVLTRITDQTPEDPRAWRFLGRELMDAGRYFEAVTALRRAAALAPEASLFADLGAALAGLNEGELAGGAEAAFEQALALDPGNAEARWSIGLARFQEGDRAAAADAWGALAADFEPGDPRRLAVALSAVDRLATPEGGPGAEGAAPFAGMAGDPSAMIETMVAGLAARLEAEPDDLSGWLTLARARSQIGDSEGARAAIAAARGALGSDRNAEVLLAAAEEGFGLVQSSSSDEAGATP
ncbi:MAG: tetratricopeptide repeat protein [Caulobacterales bacterium]|nr:tetratricopeptide repeat protein [Caulobacterales bacterium]